MRTPPRELLPVAYLCYRTGRACLLKQYLFLAGKEAAGLDMVNRLATPASDDNAELGLNSRSAELLVQQIKPDRR